MARILYKYNNDTTKIDITNITKFPKEIGEFTKLQILNIYRNRTTKLPAEIGQLTQLQELNITYNKISKLPAEIGKLIKLQKLYIFDNKIIELPKEIGQLTQLYILNISWNQITELPKEIGQLTQLQELSISHNKLTKLLKEIGQLTQLQYLDIPYNQITELSKEIGQLTQLYYLSIFDNQITELPLEIINLRNLNKFHYNDNPIENLNNPIIIRYINIMKNKRHNIYISSNIYKDSQNVHSSSIQSSVKSSIFNLMNSLKDNFNYNYLNDHILTEQTKIALCEYSNDAIVHSELGCTFEEVLNAVFNEMLTYPSETQELIKERINEEISDGLCKCFTGRISRLVNSLSSISDKVSVTISSSEEIGNIISVAFIKYKLVNEIKEHVTKEMQDRGYLKEEIEKWIAFIE